MKSFSIIMLATVGTLALFSIIRCGKEVPSGPPGHDGPAGIPNIITDSFHIAGPMSTSKFLNDSVYLYTTTDSAITPSIIAGGLVQVYLSPEYGAINGQNGNWIALPYTANGNVWNYQFSSYQISIYINTTAGTLPHPNPTSPMGATFKVVSVPPAMKAIHPNLNYKDYVEVKQAFNLPN